MGNQRGSSAFDPLSAGELSSLLDSWLLRMAAERKSDKTLKVYRDGVEQYLEWAKQKDPRADLLSPDVLAVWVNHLLDTGRAPATARLRQLAVRRFSSWLADEDEIERDLLLGVKPPKLDEPVVPALSDEELVALVKACAGKTLANKRDEAIVRLMAETGARAGEVIGMTTTDVDLSRGLALVRSGKGGRGRRLPFGPSTGAAIDRYLRARRKHRRADDPRLWLGEQSSGFTYAALWRTLRKRARHAGIEEFHPHQLRHTFASRWLRAGGTEQGLFVTAGWSRREMLDRYTRDTSAQRAADEARRLGLGDL
jgi:site-specific recombinase XerD